jgi:hypothetical protein
MTKRNSVVSLFALIALLIVLPLLAIACEPNITIWVENRTDEALIVYWNGHQIGEVAPGETAKMGPIASTGVHYFEARNPEGELVHTRKLGRSQLLDLGRKIVILPSLE